LNGLPHGSVVSPTHPSHARLAPFGHCTRALTLCLLAAWKVDGVVSTVWDFITYRPLPGMTQVREQLQQADVAVLSWGVHYFFNRFAWLTTPPYFCILHLAGS
jgi:hypothetical protein